MSFYGEMSATARDMLREFGKPVTVTLVTQGTYDPATSAKSHDAEIITATKGVQTSFSLRDVDGTSILATDVRLLVAASSLARKPKPGDRVVIAGETYGVVNSKAVEPGPVALLYAVQLRK